MAGKIFELGKKFGKNAFHCGHLYEFMLDREAVPYADQHFVGEDLFQFVDGWHWGWCEAEESSKQEVETGRH